MNEHQMIERLSQMMSALPELNVRAPDVCAERSLLELGLDSLSFVQLAVAIEEALGIEEFPLQQWADAEAARGGPQFTCGSLARMCLELQARKLA